MCGEKRLERGRGWFGLLRYGKTDKKTDSLSKYHWYNYYIGSVTEDEKMNVTMFVFITSNDGIKLLKEGSPEKDRMDGAAAVSDGGVVLTGYSSGPWGGISSSGSTDFAAVKLDAAGNVSWRWKANDVLEILIIRPFQLYRSTVGVLAHARRSADDST